jgi:hypothetical protein
VRLIDVLRLTSDLGVDASQGLSRLRLVVFAEPLALYAGDLTS